MDIRGKIMALLPSLQDDGSRELVKQWASILDDAGEIESLMVHPAFKRILDQTRLDFKKRLSTLIENDPELKAMRRMFIRTTGLSGASEQIEKALNEMVEEPNQVTPDAL